MWNKTSIKKFLKNNKLNLIEIVSKIIKFHNLKEKQIELVLFPFKMIKQKRKCSKIILIINYKEKELLTDKKVKLIRKKLKIIKKIMKMKINQLDLLNQIKVISQVYTIETVNFKDKAH